MRLLFFLLPAIFADSMALQQSSIVPVWGKADPGTTITLTTSWDKQRLTTLVGVDSTFRFSVTTPAYKDIPYGDITLSRRHHTTTIRHILFAEVWLAGGQSNMEMPMHGFWGQPVEGAYEAILHSGEGYPVRFYKTPRQLASAPQFEGKGQWYTASPSTTDKASAIGYFYARELSRILNTPVAIVESTWGGTRVQPWMPEQAYLSTQSDDELPLEIQKGNLTYKCGNELNASPIPTAMYNAMIHPLAGFGIRGLIWYQGETNIYFHSETYSDCFTAMVEGWRQAWNQGSWPVYFVQIAPFYYGPGNTAAFLRSQQDKASRTIPDCGMVVTLDVGDSACIHPVQKLPVAQRLVGLALQGTYGYTDFLAESPRPAKAEVQDNRVFLTFTNAPQLIAKRGEIRDFEVADEQGVWHPAQVRYTLRDLSVWSDEVANPHGVRYCYHNYTIGTLFSAASGLPVAPFEAIW